MLLMDASADITQALKDTENSLRDFVGSVLAEKLGVNWVEKCGGTLDRIQKWKERREIEAKRQQTGTVDERLIYYADFYDLKTILKKHWHFFSDALGDVKTFEVWLSELEKLRDPDAHRRELLPHQKHLALGLEGEIRTRIVRYRSKMETSDDYYPRIESARDNVGMVYVAGGAPHVWGTARLRPADKIQITFTARDPVDQALEYCFQTELSSEALRTLDTGWTGTSNCSYIIRESDVSKMFRISIAIRSPRKYHAHQGYDDLIMFFYEVLPPREGL